jgi:hypothetical protein
MVFLFQTGNNSNFVFSVAPIRFDPIGDKEKYQLNESFPNKYSGTAIPADKVNEHAQLVKTMQADYSSWDKVRKDGFAYQDDSKEFLKFKESREKYYDFLSKNEYKVTIFSKEPLKTDNSGYKPLNIPENAKLIMNKTPNADIQERRKIPGT